MIKIGSRVLYNDEEHIVMYIYESALCEIRKIEDGKVKLVNIQS